MRHIFWVVFFVNAALGQQQYTITEMPAISPTVSIVTRLAVGPDNKVWAVYQDQGRGFIAVKEAGQQGFSVVGGNVNPSFFSPKMSWSGRSDGPWMTMGSFFPQPGARSLLGEFTGERVNGVSTYKNVTLEATLLPSLNALCPNYSVKNAGSNNPAPVTYIGPFPSNGAYHMLLTGTDKLTSIYRLNPSGCSLDLVVKTSIWALQAWPIGNNLFLTERIVNPNFISQVSEIGTIDSGGKFTSLVKSDRSDRCDMVFDHAQQQALISCKDARGGRVVLFRNGAIREIYSGGEVSQNVRAIAINGDYAVFGGSTTNVPIATLLLANLQTGTVAVLVKAGDKRHPVVEALVGFVADTISVSTDGIVYFGGAAAGWAKTFVVAPHASVLQPQLDPISGVLIGRTATLSGKNLVQPQTVTTVLLNGTSIPFNTLGDRLDITAPSVPGTYAVQVKVVGAVEQLSNIIQLTVSAPVPVNPVFSAAAVVDNASGQNPCSPGGICSVYGTRLAIATAVASIIPLPTVLAGTQVLVNNVPAPLFFVSPGQINFQMPWETAVGQATMMVISGSLSSDSVAITVIESGPGLYRANGLAIAQDGLTGILTNTADSPAYGGQVLVLYGTGFGLTECKVATGSITPAKLCTVLQKVSVNFAGAQAQVLWAGLSPGWIGLYQINLVVPDTLPIPGDTPELVEISLEVGNRKDATSKGILLGQRRLP